MIRFRNYVLWAWSEAMSIIQIIFIPIEELGVNLTTYNITPAIKYPKVVIPAKAGIQGNTLDAASSPTCKNPGIILPG